MTMSVSTARSVTTVPKAFEKEIPSQRFSTPQRVNSPIRGITRLTAQDRNMAQMLVEALGDSPKGSNVCFHRQPRNICARIPKGKERSIHVQSISWVMTWQNRPKSSPLYIQYRIAPPRRTGKIILAALMKTVFNSMGAKIVQIERNTKFIWIFPRCPLSSGQSLKGRHPKNQGASALADTPFSDQYLST